MKKDRDGEKVRKQDGMSTIIINYNDKIIMKYRIALLFRGAKLSLFLRIDLEP